MLLLLLLDFTSKNCAGRIKSCGFVHLSGGYGQKFMNSIFTCDTL